MICFQALWKTKSFVKVCLKFKLPLWTKGGIISLCIAYYMRPICGLLSCPPPTPPPPHTYPPAHSPYQHTLGLISFPHRVICIIGYSVYMWWQIPYMLFIISLHHIFIIYSWYSLVRVHGCQDGTNISLRKRQK